MDAKNTIIQHSLVFTLTLILVSVFYFLLDIPLTNSLARTSYFLLFLILLVGPLTKIKNPTNVSSPLLVPWSWRGEFGIWFTIVSLFHFIVTWRGSSLSRLIRIGGSGYSLANMIGLIALFYAVLLAATSFGKIIVFLGVQSWKWLHSFAYVIFYLVSAHMMYFQFFSTHGDSGPDWFGYTAGVMSGIVIVMQLTAFIITVSRQKSSAKRSIPTKHSQQKVVSAEFGVN